MLNYDWRQNLVDATFAEWFVVAAYLIAAVAAAMAAHSSLMSRRSEDRLFWSLVVACLAFLAVNEVLDLQTLLTVIGKQAAIDGGWYGQRRTVQFWFIAALIGAVVIGGLAALRLTHRSAFDVRLAMVGLAFIMAFIVIRAASFHHMDELLGRSLSVIDYGTVQEVAGIAIVAWAARSYVRKSRVKRR